MANGSEGERKQAEPEGKQTSQVRLEWGQVRTSPDVYCAQLTTCFLSVSAGNADGTWLGYVSLRCEDMRVFATKEKAQIWCEAQLKELLQKDLKSLGGDVQAEPAEVTP